MCPAVVAELRPPSAQPAAGTYLVCCGHPGRVWSWLLTGLMLLWSHWGTLCLQLTSLPQLWAHQRSGRTLRVAN